MEEQCQREIWRDKGVPIRAAGHRGGPARSCVKEPVSAAIDATWFNFYHGGVFTGPCGNTPNHGVTIVGYGTTTEAEGQQPYWLVKNRWGTNWGEGGSMRIFRGVGGSGLCNIAANAAYPL